MERLTLRQEPLNLQLPARVDVIGAGGVGSWCAIALAMAGCPVIYLWDGDTITGHNLNRIPLPPNSNGRKADLIADLIRTLRPSCRIIPCGKWSAATADVVCVSRDLGGQCWMLATTDTLASRREVWKWCCSHGWSYIEAAAEGETGSAAGCPAEWDTPEESMPGYASVPVWIGPCLQAATYAVAYVLHGVPPAKDMIMRAGWNGENYETVSK